MTAHILPFPTPDARRHERRSSPVGRIQAFEGDIALIADLIAAIENRPWMDVRIDLVHPRGADVRIKVAIGGVSGVLSAADTRLMARAIADDLGGNAGAFAIVAELNEAADLAADQNARLSANPPVGRGELVGWALLILIACVLGVAIANGAWMPRA